MPGLTINNVGNASRKRSRRQDDGDSDEAEDEVVDVQEASSGLQGEPVCHVIFELAASESPYDGKHDRR